MPRIAPAECGPCLRGCEFMLGADHRFFRRRLDAFVDDELGGDDVDRVAGHLLDCPDCSAHVRFLLRVRAVLLTVGAARRAEVLDSEV